MGGAQLQPEQLAVLSALANGIIPADATDAGAAAVDAGPRLTERIRTGVNAGIYLRGLELARSLAHTRCGHDVSQLSPAEVHDLLAAIRDRLPAFFKQLRMDVSALYLSDPAVWQRIGFPGPSAEAGGHPDFDRPQTATLVPLTRRTPAMNDPTTATATAAGTLTVPALLPAVEAFLSKPARMLIDGKWVEAAGGGWIDALDPATGKPIGRFPAGGAADVDAAVAAARRAFQGGWRTLTPYERGRLLQKCASAIESHADELAQLVTLDNGKPLWEAKKEVATAVAWVDYYAGWCTKLTGDTIPLSLPGSYLNYTTREPLGVVVGIPPPNYPLTMPLYKAAPALATGNTVILKPAEQTSLVALRLGELFLDAGLPEGAMNVVTGYGDAAGAA